MGLNYLVKNASDEIAKGKFNRTKAENLIVSLAEQHFGMRLVVGEPDTIPSTA